MARTKAVSPVTSPTPTPVETTAPSKAPLTQEQIILGATNDPALSNDTFVLDGKTYKYVHLSYDYYIEFMLKIKPLLTAVVGVVASKARATVTIPGIELVENPLSNIINFAGKDIPDMVRIIINNSLEFENKEERITVEEIRKMRGVTPMSLSNIIVGQVVYNNMITEFASFFVQMMPLLKQMGILTQPEAKTSPVK